MLDFSQYAALTFDCYGTLIDWESGILGALHPLLAQKGVLVSDALLLETYGRLESEAEKGVHRIYKEILQRVAEGIGNAFGFSLDSEERRILVTRFHDWKPFPDTVSALQRLKRRYALHVLSNIDNDLFAISAEHLQTEFDGVLTAQDIGSYKPDPRNFLAMQARLGLPKERILHVAQSLYHDIAPANALGIATVWVNRRGDQAGAGATPQATATPDLVVPDLKTLADIIETQLTSRS